MIGELAAVCFPQCDTFNNVIRRIDMSSAQVSTFAGGRGFDESGSTDGNSSSATFSGPIGIALDAAGRVAVVVSDALR